MNNQLWNMYKESSRGKDCIELFNPEIENISEGAFNIWRYASSWGEDKVEDSFREDIDYMLWLWSCNLFQRGFIPDEWTRENYQKFSEEYDIIEPLFDEKGELQYHDDNETIIFNESTILLRKDQYRRKAANIPLLSLLLYYNFECFKPMLLPGRFDVIQRNCEALGIEMPSIPRSKDYKTYVNYYFEICERWNEFQKEHEMSDAELCACIYDFASMLIETNTSSELPKPTNVWLTGASGSDFTFLDSLGKTPDGNGESIWACNERTRRGDIIVLYCTSPRSYIHSIWRSNSGGIFNPFDYYHCRTTVCDGILTPHITYKDLKNDNYMSQVPIVRRNLQGVNGIELSAKDYSELIRMIGEKGGDVTLFPLLYEGSNLDFGEIKLEKHVEEKILIPVLEKLGYTNADWTRQLSQKAGRTEKAIPDFVFFPKGKKHFENSPMIIEAKFDMVSAREFQKAFNQALSYARLLRASIMGICDKERLVLYKVNIDGGADRNNPIFENHWASIYSDAEVGATLNHLIGREVVANM